MAENDRLPIAPVLAANLGAVFRRDGWHRFLLSVSVLARW
jgi:hypothetical protein